MYIVTLPLPPTAPNMHTMGTCSFLEQLSLTQDNPISQSNPSSLNTVRPPPPPHYYHLHRRFSSALPSVSPTLLFAFFLWLAMQDIDYASVWRTVDFADHVLQLQALDPVDRRMGAARKRRVGKEQRPCARPSCDADYDGSLCFGAHKTK